MTNTHAGALRMIDPSPSDITSVGRLTCSPSHRHPELSGLVGRTPVLRIPDLRPGAGPEPDTGTGAARGRGFWAKLEGTNPGGIKDRPALHMIARARDRGDLRPGAPIVESTSGTLGLGLALAGQVYGHPVVLVGDPGLEPLLRRLLRAYGARLELVTEPHPTGGWQEARRVRVAELMDELPGAYCPDQYNNPDNAGAYAALAAELLEDFPRIDALVCAVGTGGHSAGVGRVIRGRFPGVRIVGVDSVGSTVFGQPARPRLMRGLGSSIHPRNVAYDLFSEVHWVAPAEAVWACRRLASRHLMSGGWSVGAVALVASWTAAVLPPEARVVAIFPDGPWRYWDTVYDDDYCRAHRLLEAAPPARPAQIGHPTEREVTSWTRCRTVADPLSRVTGLDARLAGDVAARPAGGHR
ncbi:PLP-dependent cysteine synthase family protein [Spirillospora albida]|uniref:PLP-dependent cysteine synthase family protein n=1 Tax=Spirillospora albida TaxID=58123 RepID=UPI000A023982|nr:PLP-dependent cysteine synthase family protein [Spirillospora albida]